MGGMNVYPETLRSAEVFDPSTGAWTELPPMTSRRADVCSMDLRSPISNYWQVPKNWGCE